jgi:hypothetical protein
VRERERRESTLSNSLDFNWIKEGEVKEKRIK